MNKIKKLPLLLFTLLIMLTAVAALFYNGGTSAVYAYGEYDFEFTDFHVTYDIRTNRTMDVTLDLGVHYQGTRSTGFMHDIPVNAGDRVRNISAYELDGIGGNERHLSYGVKQEFNNFITVDIGDSSLKNHDKPYYYRVRYEYAITKPANKNAIYLNAIGFGSEAAMNNVTVVLNLPDGFTGAKYFAEKRDTESEGIPIAPVGNTITLKTDYLPAFQGITFQLDFKDGVLSTKPDLTPYWVIIAACVILALLFAVKFLLFNKDGLSPVVNTEAPNDMDPLVMGKLIDHKVDKSDITSLIYYWANKGYLKIDLKDNDGDDVELIRIRKNLPKGSPQYQTRMYDKLFASGDIVKLSDLTCKFYGTVEAVTKTVNAENSKLYSGKSMAFAVLFALIGGLVMALTPIIIALTTISSKLFLIAPLFMVVPAFIIFALTQTVRYNKLKFKKSKMILLYSGIALLAALFSVIYVLVLPSYYVEVIPKIILCVVGFAIVMLSPCIISRTDEYVEKLNHIVGFRDYIIYTEKEKLEVMLEQNPEFYYQVLPYAIVLGVSDIWENKFASLTVAPPSWTTRSYANDVFNIMVFNSLMRRANTRMTSAFISRPASRPSSGSFSGGGSHGGSFGGFSGGGHGGGGFRGR
ncbi:MAG: DUF2207 domain-containing protein [Clostridia bacterium]|nr:DUF2207 domain-containing protein [Clostridia bacterium]